MKQKKQKGNNPRTTDKKRQPGSASEMPRKCLLPRKRGKKGCRHRVNTSVKISTMERTEKVDRDTVLRLCSQVLNDNKGIAMNRAIMHSNQLKDNHASSKNKNKNDRGKPAPKETPGKPPMEGKKGVAMNYKELKKLRKEQAEKEAAAKKAAQVDNERVLAKKGLQITAKMIKAAKEKDAHRQGILHLWGRPGSGAFKERRKRGGKH